MSEHAWLVPCCHFFFSLSGFVLPLCTKKKVQCVAFHHEMSKSFWYPDVFSFWCIYSLRQPTSFKSLHKHTHTHKKQQHCRLMSVMIASVKSQNSARFPLGTLCKLFSTLWSNLYNLEVSQCYDFTYRFGRVLQRQVWHFSQLCLVCLLWYSPDVVQDTAPHISNKCTLLSF